MTVVYFIAPCVVARTASLEIRSEQSLVLGEEMDALPPFSSPLCSCSFTSLIKKKNATQQQSARSLETPPPPPKRSVSVEMKNDTTIDLCRLNGFLSGASIT
jgi:hypothetical protein